MRLNKTKKEQKKKKAGKSICACYKTHQTCWQIRYCADIASSETKEPRVLFVKDGMPKITKGTSDTGRNVQVH